MHNKPHYTRPILDPDPDLPLHLWMSRFAFRIYISLFIPVPGFVGVFDFVLLSPMVLLWHYSDLEVFELPSPDVWTLLLVNGFVGTVLSELLWLW